MTEDKDNPEADMDSIADALIWMYGGAKSLYENSTLFKTFCYTAVIAGTIGTCGVFPKIPRKITVDHRAEALTTEIASLNHTLRQIYDLEEQAPPEGLTSLLQAVSDPSSVTYKTNKTGAAKVDEYVFIGDRPAYLSIDGLPIEDLVCTPKVQ